MNFGTPECEGNFGSQDPYLQPNAQDRALISAFFQSSPARKAELKAQIEAERQGRVRELAVDSIGSQDPEDQPTAEDFAMISQHFQAQKRLRAQAAENAAAAQAKSLRKAA